MEFLEIKQLKKYFPTPKGMLHAVDDVTLSISCGKTLGVVGESGCGKSTLGKAILQLERATAGEIWFDGGEISRLSKKKYKPYRTRLQMIFQDPYASLDPRMSIMKLLSEPLDTYKLTKTKDETQRRVYDLMEVVGLNARYAHSYPHELDGGRRQRIGIARALSLEPEFIVCDEPVSALDVSIQAQILNLLKQLQKDKNLTYMFITHDLSVVRHISDDICVMYLGRVVEKCASKELFRNTIHPYTRALLSAVPVPSLHNRRERKILMGELASPVDPKPQCRFAPRCEFASEECFASEPDLMDIGGDHFVACHKFGQV